jgi:HEAT repeat protein
MKIVTATMLVAAGALSISVWWPSASSKTVPAGEVMYEGKPLREWLRKLDASLSPEHKEAVRVVQGIGSNGVPDLILMLKLKDPTSKGDVGLNYGNANARANAARKLGQLGPSAEVAIPHLIEALNDRVPKVRYYAAGALGQFGPEASEAIPGLRAMRRKDSDGRAFAAWALEEIQSKPHSEGVLAAMARATTNDSDAIAEPAVALLYDRGRSDLAIPPLLDMLAVKGSGTYKDSGSWAIYPIRAASRIAMLGPNAREAVDPLTVVLSSSDEFARTCAARALGEIGEEAKPTLPLMLEMLSDDERADGGRLKSESMRAAVERAVRKLDSEALNSDQME